MSLGLKLIDFTPVVDSDYKTMTKGLLGNYDGDATNDFIQPDGTVLSNNTSERDLFAYGQLCESIISIIINFVLLDIKWKFVDN